MWLVACIACAVNSLEQGFLCPICGTHWEQRIETSGHSRGLRLDLRQLGDVVDPPTLPQCPKCRFPLFSERLIEQAKDPAKEKAFKRLRTFVLGPDFQMLAAKNPSYFALALVQAVIGDERHPTPHRYIALSYLRASWQVEDRSAACRRSLEKAREHYVAALDPMDAQDPQRGDLALLCGEIERRLEKWDEAESRFRELDSSEFLKDTPRAAIPAIQLRLIARRDSAPHTLDGGEIVVNRPPPEREMKFENPGQISMASNRAEMPVALKLDLPPQAPVAELPALSLKLEPMPGATLTLASPPPDAAILLPPAPMQAPALTIEKTQDSVKPVSPPKPADLELPAVFFELPEPLPKLPSAPFAKAEGGLMSALAPAPAATLPLPVKPVPAPVEKRHGRGKTTLPPKSPEEPLPLAPLQPPMLPMKTPDESAKPIVPPNAPEEPPPAVPVKAPVPPLPPASPVKPDSNFSDNPD